MKSFVRPIITTFLLATSLIAPIFAEETEEAPAVDPKAKEIIERAADFLANAKQFRVSAEIWQDLEIRLSEMAQFSKVVDIQLRRPDRLRLDVPTSVPKRSFYYDGASLTVFDRARGLFATARHPQRLTRRWS